MTFDTFKWENYIDELRVDINFEDASGCTPYVLTSEDVESSNIYKRTLCILLCLLTKKGICQMEYKPSDYVAFLKDDLESIYQTNPEYVNCMLKFLASYNWTIPKGYYSEFDEEKDWAIIAKGFEEIGYEKGIEKGKKEGMKNIINIMLSNGTPKATILKQLNITEKEYEKLLN